MIPSNSTVLVALLTYTRRRCVANWSKVVESFTSAAETLMNKAIKEIENFINNELAGPSGPATAYKGQ